MSIIDEKAWLRAYIERGALWIHDGNPKRPHVLLASGKHSDGYFDSRPVTEDEYLRSEAVFDLGRLLMHEGVNLGEIDFVVGPATGATKLAMSIAYMVGAARKRVCGWSSPKKDESGEIKRMVFTGDDNPDLRGCRVLLCEDVRTTGGSLERTADAVRLKGGIILHDIPVLVDRSTEPRDIADGKVLALIRRPMPIWTPAECPLCKVRSKAISPTDGNNWSLLTATY